MEYLDSVSNNRFLIERLQSQKQTKSQPKQSLIKVNSIRDLSESKRKRTK